MYLVYISKGNWDEAVDIPQFVTSSEFTASEWVDRYDDILGRYKDFLEERYPEGYDGEDNDAWYKIYTIHSYNFAKYEKIELR